MTKAEAWLQCSARGTMVTRLAYIGGFYPSCAKGRTRDGDPSIGRERHRGTSESPETPRNPRRHLGSKLGVPFSPLVASSSTSSSHRCIIIQLEEQLVLVTLSYTPSRIVLQ